MAWSQTSMDTAHCLMLGVPYIERGSDVLQSLLSGQSLVATEYLVNRLSVQYREYGCHVICPVITGL